MFDAPVTYLTPNLSNTGPGYYRMGVPGAAGMGSDNNSA